MATRTGHSIVAAGVVEGASVVGACVVEKVMSTHLNINRVPSWCPIFVRIYLVRLTCGWQAGTFAAVSLSSSLSRVVTFSKPCHVNSMNKQRCISRL